MRQSLLIAILSAFFASLLQADDRILSSISMWTEEGTSIMNLVSFPHNQRIILGARETLMKGTAFEVRRDGNTIWRTVMPIPEHVRLGEDPYVGLLAASAGSRIFVILATRNTGWLGIAEISTTAEAISNDEDEDTNVIRVQPDALAPSKSQKTDVFASPPPDILARLPQIQQLFLVETDDSPSLIFKVKSRSATLLSYDPRKNEWMLVNESQPGSKRQ